MLLLKVASRGRRGEVERENGRGRARGVRRQKKGKGGGGGEVSCSYGSRTTIPLLHIQKPEQYINLHTITSQSSSAHL